MIFRKPNILPRGFYRQWRIARGMRQKALAAKVGVSARQIRNIETYRRQPSAGLLMRLAKVLRCSPLALLTIDPSDAIAALFDDLATMSEIIIQVAVMIVKNPKKSPRKKEVTHIKKRNRQFRFSNHSSAVDISNSLINKPNQRHGFSVKMRVSFSP